MKVTTHQHSHSGLGPPECPGLVTLVLPRFGLMPYSIHEDGRIMKILCKWVCLALSLPRVSGESVRMEEFSTLGAAHGLV